MEIPTECESPVKNPIYMYIEPLLKYPREHASIVAHMRDIYKHLMSSVFSGPHINNANILSFNDVNSHLANRLA